MAVFTCALATGSTWRSAAERSPANHQRREPVAVAGLRGSRPCGGAARCTRRTGRRRSEASPVRTESPGTPASTPASRRRLVPELPQSMTSSGSRERLRRRHHHLRSLLADAWPRAPPPRGRWSGRPRRRRMPRDAGLARGQGGEEQRAVRRSTCRRAPRMVPRSGPRRRQVSGPVQNSSSRARRAASSAARAASGDSATADRMASRCRPSRAAAPGRWRVAARDLALDVEGERRQPGHVAQRRAGQRSRRAAPPPAPRRPAPRRPGRAGARPWPPRRRARRRCSARRGPRARSCSAATVSTAVGRRRRCRPPPCRPATGPRSPRRSRPCPPNIGWAPTKATPGRTRSRASATSRSLAPPTSVRTAPSGRSRETGPSSSSMPPTGVQRMASRQRDEHRARLRDRLLDDAVADRPLAHLAPRLHRHQAHAGPDPPDAHGEGRAHEAEPDHGDGAGECAHCRVVRLRPHRHGFRCRSGRSASAPRR